MKINPLYSPNFDKKKRSKNLIKILVIHYTGMQSERESIKRLCNKKSKVSCHFLINENGKIYRLVKDQQIAWHAGKSCWGRYKNLNKNSIGIELVNKGHKLGYTSFKKKQILSLIKICKILIRKYKIKKQNIESDIYAFYHKIYFKWVIMNKNDYNKKNVIGLICLFNNNNKIELSINIYLESEQLQLFIVEFIKWLISNNIILDNIHYS